MIILSTTSSILDSRAERLVCPVNAYGVMGAGLAKVWAKNFPEDVKAFQTARMAGHTTFQPFGPGEVISAGRTYFVATKRHWSDPSQLEWIKDGAAAILSIATVEDVGSVAVPALGCGLGGLHWSAVEPVLRSAFTSTSVKFSLHVPKGVWR